MSETDLRKAILGITQYTHELFNSSAISEDFEVNAIDFEIFEELYRSIHEEHPADQIPMFRVAGATNLKDSDVPGYVAFSLPKSFLKDSASIYTFKEFIINATHTRFERYLLKETIIAKIYEKAREDYHSLYTLDKEKNVAAIILYNLNKDLIPLQETITYSVNYLVDAFIEENFPLLNQIPLPLIDRDFNEMEQNVTKEFLTIQFNGAQIDKVEFPLLLKRFKAGQRVLQIITQKFQELCDDFLELYPIIKAELQSQTPNMIQYIEVTIQTVLQNNGLSDITALYEQEYANL